MQGLFHSLQIGTLSTWLSVAGFGTVGICVHPWQPPAPAPLAPAQETEIIPNDFHLDAPLGPSGDSQTATALESPPTPTDTPDVLPAPPELAPLADLSPLPEIPDLPPPPPEPAPAPAPAAVREAREAPRSAAPAPSSNRLSSSSSNTRSSSTASRSSSSTSGTGSAAATTSRLAAGRMPAPAYPASAKRAGQTGTVVVEFTIGTDGRVISAYAKSACPWHSLNEAAVAAVRRWKFPPGGVIKTQRPIVFQLR